MCLQDFQTTEVGNCRTRRERSTVVCRGVQHQAQREGNMLLKVWTVAGSLASISYSDCSAQH